MLLSIMPSAPSAASYIITGILSLLLVVVVWKVRKYPHKLSYGGIFVALLLCLLYYLFPMGGSDFYSYKEWVETAGYTNINQISQYYLHYEKPYYVIVNIVHNNYFFFRLIVWGGSLLLYWRSAIRLELDKSTFLFYLCIVIVHLTCVSRVCLSYALAFYGFSFLVKPISRKGNNLFSYIIGTALIIISLFFHRSALFLLLLLPLSLFNLNKRTIWLFVLAFPAIVVLISTNVFDYILNFDQTDSSLLDSETASLYLESDKKRVVGLGQSIEFFFKYGSHVVMVLLIAKCILSKAYQSWPTQIQKFANATLYITVIAFALYLAPGASTYKTFERLIAFAYVPESFFMTHLLKNDYEKKIVTVFNLLITAYIVYGALYYNIYFGIVDF